MKVLVLLVVLTITLCHVEGASRCYHCDKTKCSDPKDKETCPKDDACVTVICNNAVTFRGCQSTDHHEDPGIIYQYSYVQCYSNLCNTIELDPDPDRGDDDNDPGSAATPSISTLCVLTLILPILMLH